MDPISSLVVGLCFVTVAIFLYCLPWYIAARRKHHNKVPIALLNIFFGWSLIGWMAALMWAFTNPPPRD